jgi:hypothetical protein
MRTPVVASSLAAGGIEAEAERHLLVADTPEQFAAQVSRCCGMTSWQLDWAPRDAASSSRSTVGTFCRQLESVHEAVLARSHSAKKLLN